MGDETKTYLDSETSSNPMLPKIETSDFNFPCSTQVHEGNVASSSGSNLKSFFAGMGFSLSLVDKVLNENGEDNPELLLEILMECSGTQKSISKSSDSKDAMFDDYNESNPPACPAVVIPKEEPDEFGADDDKRASLLRMNFSVMEVDFAMDKLGGDAPVDEIIDFILAGQVAAKLDKEVDFQPDGDAETNQDISNDALFKTMEKTLCLLELGFSENEISLAIERFGAETPVSELANLICSEQVGEKYTIKRKYSMKHSGRNSSQVLRGCESFGMEVKNDQGLGFFHDKIKTEDYGQDATSWSSNLNLEEVHRGKRPKQEFENYSYTQLGHIGFEEICEGKRLKPEYTEASSYYFQPTSIEEKVFTKITGFEIPRAPKSTSCKSVDRMVTKPPFFFYGNVASVFFPTWRKISQFLYGIEPEFVNTQFFSALSREEGYVHNLPTENRFHILPKPPMSIQDVMPHTKKWWPLWDTRKQLSCINSETAGVSHLCDRLGRMLTESRGVLLSEQKRDILYHCQKFNLTWIGPCKVGPIEPEYLEIILGYPLNHTQAAEIDVTERLHSLRYCYQIDTLGYHLSVLKCIFPKGITVLSIMSGIGGAEVVLHRLGIHMKGVVSVETCETKRRILRRWWMSSGQTGELEQIEHIQKLTSKKINELIDKFGSFELIICENPCTHSSKCPKPIDAASDFDFTLFYEFVRVLQRLRSLMERKR